MARDRLPTRIHRNGARMYNPKGIGEWVEKQGWRIDDKSFVNLRNDWIVVMCYAVM